nr:zinc knuckle CX2CX4HX4C [Tanacetum cinerariifolium]
MSAKGEKISEELSSDKRAELKGSIGNEKLDVLSGLMDQRGVAIVREGTATRVNLDESGATCDGSPKADRNVIFNKSDSMPKGFPSFKALNNPNVDDNMPGMVSPSDLIGRSSFARCLIEGRSSFARCLIERPSRCDLCKIFGHVNDQCLKKVVTPTIVSTSPIVTLTVEKTNDGFQMVGKKKKRKGFAMYRLTTPTACAKSSLLQIIANIKFPTVDAYGTRDISILSSSLLGLILEDNLTSVGNRVGDYSRPSHEGYRNTIKIPDGNNVVPMRSDTIRMVQNGCSFHGLRSEDPNQHLKDFLKLLESLDLDDHVSIHLKSEIDPANGGKLRDKKTEESWEIIKNLALYNHEEWNDPSDYAKPVKAISLPVKETSKMID